MNRLVISLITLALAFGAVATAQQPASPPADAAVIEEALTRARSEGAEAAIAILEASRSSAGLSDEATSLLGSLLIEVGRGEEALGLLLPLTEGEDANAATLFHAWRAAQQIGRGGELIELLERSVEIDPVSPAGRELGLILGRVGDLRGAYLLLRPWVEAFPDDRAARLGAAVCAVELKRIPEAEALLAELPRELPQVGILWAKVLMERADPWAALATLKALPEDLPPAMDMDRRRTLALANMSTGQSGEAAKLLEGRVGENPGLALLLSQAQSQSGDVEAALATVTPFAEAVLADSSGWRPELAAGILVDYGRQLIATGRASDALPALEKATELDPNNKLAFQSLGQSLAAAGRREEAQTALARFNELTGTEATPMAKNTEIEAGVDDPTGAQIQAAMRLAGQGRIGEAMQIVQDEQQMSPADPRPLLVEAQFLFQLGRLDDALAVADRALEVSPDNPDCHYQRAVTLMALQKPEEAEAEYRRALEIAETHSPAMNDLAVLLMMQERNDEARGLLERALEINPDDELAAGNLAQIDG